MLPWLARKAGISEAHAEELWAEAVICATVQTGWVGTAQYWKAAVDRLVELMELESQTLRTITIERETIGRPAFWFSSVIVAQDQKTAA
jgi:hypothetical protein